MKKKRFLALILTIITLISLTACGDSVSISSGSSSSSSSTSNSSEATDVADKKYDIMMYDNQGNNYLNFKGSRFQVTPNKSKQWGYNTDGSWTSYFETSSVISINIDGSYVQSCGSTVIFKDSSLELLDTSEVVDTSGETANENSSPNAIKSNWSGLKDYAELTMWWYHQKALGQHGSKIILVQSQDGYNIGAFAGDDITWEVASKVPKTTTINIDGKKLYIHRCNFTIIDTNLIGEPQE